MNSRIAGPVNNEVLLKVRNPPETETLEAFTAESPSTPHEWHLGERVKSLVNLVKEAACRIEIFFGYVTSNLSDIEPGLGADKEPALHSRLRPCFVWRSRRTFSKSARVISAAGPLSSPSLTSASRVDSASSISRK